MNEKKMMRKVGKVVFFILLIPVLAYAFIHLVMYLWNGLMPNLFGLTTITFWQAAGLLLLSKILFGGFNFNKSKCKCNCKKKRYRDKIKDKFMNLSDEEMEKMKEEWAARCAESKTA